MTSFKIEWHKKAIKELRKIPRTRAKQLLLAVDSLKKEPITNSLPLRGCSFRKVRAGNYRAILQVLNSKKIIRVLLVGHRKNIYKKMKGK